jgi:hypothetical protein
LALVLVGGVTACGSDGDARSRAERRAACYPVCLGEIITRCPLVTACTVSEEADSSIGESLGETPGVATCFDSGEQMRYGTSVADGLEHYRVKADDGTLCYEAIGKFPDYDIFVDGALAVKFEDQRAHGYVDVGCRGALARIDVRRADSRDCGRLPWDPAPTCDPAAGCSFSPLP